MTEPLDRMVLGITEDLQIASTHVAMHFLRSSTERHSITLATFNPLPNKSLFSFVCTFLSFENT